MTEVSAIKAATPARLGPPRNRLLALAAKEFFDELNGVGRPFEVMLRADRVAARNFPPCFLEVMIHARFRFHDVGTQAQALTRHLALEGAQGAARGVGPHVQLIRLLLQLVHLRPERCKRFRRRPRGLRTGLLLCDVPGFDR